MAARSYPRESTEFGRGLSFFDAIYAVAITLLIVNIDPPSVEHWESWDAFVGSGVLEQLLAFTISFAVIANFWKINHRLMGDVTALDGPLINANIIAIFFIVVLPFSTASMAEVGTSDQPLPVVLYAVNIICASLGQNAIWRIAERRGLTEASAASRRASALSFVAPVVFALSIPIAFAFGPNPARYSWLLLLLVGPISRAVLKRRDAD